MAIPVGEEPRTVARSRLLDAMGRREVHLLRAAIQEGIKVSLASDVLEVAAQVLRQEESALAAGQRRVAAEAELQQAVASCNVERLRAAVKLGGTSCVNADVLNNAMQTLAREEQKFFARQSLRSAIAGRVPAALKAAIEQAKVAGLQQELSESMAALACMEQAAAAQTRLEAAIAKPEVGELAVAIEAGKKAMVPQSLLDCAQIILQNMQRRDATAEVRNAVQAKLEDAIRMPQLELLRSLIEQAKEVSVDFNLINRAYVVLAQEEQKEKAVAELAVAVSSKDSCAIRSALHVARTLQVPECRLTDAVTAVDQDDRRITAQSKLKQAIASSDVNALRLAIQEAKEAGIDANMIDSTEAAVIRLQKLQTLQTRAVAELKDAVKHPTVEGLQAAIDNGKSAGVALDVLNSALKALSEERFRVAMQAGQSASSSATQARSSSGQKIVKQVCPNCHASFASLEEVRAHWQAVHGPAASAAVTATAREGSGYPQKSAVAAADTAGADKKQVKQICPTCYASFASLEAVRSHWLEVHGTSNAGLSGDAAASSSSSAEVQSAVGCPPCAEAGGKQVKQICPTCHESFTSLDAVRAHWLEVHAPASSAGSQAGAAGPVDTLAVGAERDKIPVEMQCESVHVVACDDEGKPAVMRKVEPETGAAKTIVLNSDGSQRVFGESTVLSMASSDEAKVNEWIAGMTNIQLRGLVHEVTERVVEGSTRYHNRRNDLQKVSDRLNLQYFGLPADAKERELDNVYRKFARSMHPDKNGGTEQAKEKFQSMKTRYEALKKQFTDTQQSSARKEASSASASDTHDSASTRETGAASGANDASQSKKSKLARDAEKADREKKGEQVWQDWEEKERNEAYEEDEEQARAETDVEKLDCDWSSRASLEDMAWKMLRQMKSIKQNMDIIEGELQRFSAAQH